MDRSLAASEVLPLHAFTSLQKVCRLRWHVCAPEVASGQNALQGVEKLHYECRIDNESNARGNK